MLKFQKPKQKKTFAVIAAFLSLLSVFMMGGCSLFPEEEPPIQVPLIESDKPEYSTIKAVRGTIEDAVKGSGVVVPKQQFNVMFDQNATGYLKTMNFDGGDTVNQGDILCTLDSGYNEEDAEINDMRYEISKINYNEAKKRYNNGEIDKRQWLQAQIDFKLATREYERVKATYEATVLRAPISGVIIYKNNMMLGEMVSPKITMYRVADTSEIYVEYKGNNHNRIPLFSECKLTVQRDSQPVTYTGKVIMSPENDENSPDFSRYSIVIKPEEAFPNDLEINTSVEIYYLIDKSENALIIPTSCIHMEGTKQYVFVVQDGYRQQRDIIIGITSGYYVEVLSGLSEDDLIIN